MDNNRTNHSFLYAHIQTAKNFNAELRSYILLIFEVDGLTFMDIAIIGGSIAGCALALLFKDTFNVTVLH